MACFLVPAAEAVVTTIVEKSVKSKEAKAEKNDQETSVSKAENHIPFSRKLKWLNTMLWGGAILLLFEHLWHGEVTPFFPFLTAARDSGDAAEMLQEMSTVGITMAVLITVVWIGMVIVSNIIEKRPSAVAETEKSR